MFKSDGVHAFKATRQGRSPRQQGTARRQAGEGEGEGLGAPPLAATASQDPAGPDASPRPTHVREEWLTPDEAAALLKCSRPALYQKVARMQVPYRKHGRKLLFVRSELEAILHALPGLTLQGVAEVQRMLRGGQP